MNVSFKDFAIFRGIRDNLQTYKNINFALCLYPNCWLGSEFFSTVAGDFLKGENCE